MSNNAFHRKLISVISDSERSDMNELEFHLWQATRCQLSSWYSICVCFALISMFKETNMEIPKLETCLKKYKASYMTVWYSHGRAFLYLNVM